ncbi:MAG: D-glycero-beta-D-manno-heptose-7-phosphate kinase [Alphaproteobacteria bacterium]|nr:D-glycero-beta-D-manno-heptose-7-phosphate kinase [Alphaproteobacteria bacterium]
MSLPSTLDFSAATILCIGDVMLDRFVYGGVDRISPESPVPILRTSRDFTVVGGAGNVVRNIASLGGNVIFISVIGDDSPGQTTRDHLDAISNCRTVLIAEKNRKTTRKTRFIAQGQQLLRVDDEVILPCAAATEDEILRQVRAFLPECQVLVLSDYNKGIFKSDLCKKIIDLVRDLTGETFPIIVDPKGRNYEPYKGATLITPNQKELTEIAGQSLTSQAMVVDAANTIRQQFGFESVLVTQGAQGITLVQGADHAQQAPAQVREVFDVSGAGDTVVAALAVGLAENLSLWEACRLANTAAGIAVGKVGTSTVSIDELQASIGHHHDSLHGAQKVLTVTNAVDRLKDWRRQGLKVGFTNGCFDLLHLGHLSLLQQCAAACDKLIIGLNSDASVKRLKGDSRPVQSEETRAHVLAALGMVDAVVIFEEDTPFDLICALLPDVLVKGADYTIDRVVGADIVQRHGGEVLLAELKAGHSTTSTIERLGS